MLEINKIYNEDCLEGMKKICDKSINMILCDLPYGTTSCDWDTVIPDQLLWSQYDRILKDNGVVVLFGKEPFTSNLINNHKSEFKEKITWLKNKAGNGFNATQKHIQVTEDICVFSNSPTYTFNPQKWLVNEKEFLTQRKTFNEVEVGNNIYGKIKRIRKPDTGERNPINIISCAVPIIPAKSKIYSADIDLRMHPTQKPVALCEYLINTYSNESETILDNCMGSGTTAIACLNLNRNYIGFELDKVYFDICCKRINERKKIDRNK